MSLYGNKGTVDIDISIGLAGPSDELMDTLKGYILALRKDHGDEIVSFDYKYTYKTDQGSLTYE